MDPSLLILTLGIYFCFLAVCVQSQQNVSPVSKLLPSLSKKSLAPLLSKQSRSPPPPQQKHHPPPPTTSMHSAPKMTNSENKHSNHDQNHHKSHGQLPPPKKQKKKPNLGKKLGLVFVGVAAILQVCVVAILLIKRRQLLKADNRF